MEKQVATLKNLVAAIELGVEKLKEKAYGFEATSVRKNLQETKKLCGDMRKVVSDNAKKAKVKK